MEYGALTLALTFTISFAGAAQSTLPAVNSSVKDTPPSKSAPASRAVVLPPEKARPVSIPRFYKKPVIDGKLDDEVWKSAAILGNFYQTNPGDNTPPSKPTEVLIGYDEKTLYIAFRAHDEPDKVRATVPKRDGIWDDDYVGMFVDTFNDKRKAYALFWSPLGVQADGILTEGRGEDYSLDIVMESKGVVGEDGYVVEIAIPFKSLRYEAGNGKLWNVHFFRRIKRFNNELDSWMPISRDKSGTMNQAGQITGLEGISTERTLEIIPSLTLSESARREGTMPLSTRLNNPGVADPGRFVNKPAQLDPGISLKLGITPTVTLDFAANPDFAQVEADQTVVTANQRFPIFFEEKRPFFLEGIDIFQTPIQAVHTRTIIDPDLAVKLSGKRGRTTFGFLLASDNAPGNFSEEERNDSEVRAGIEKFLDKNAYIGVVRLKRDIGKESSLGLIATSYNFIEKHNQLGGFDGRFRIDPKTVFSFQALGTTSRRFFYDPAEDRSTYRTGNALAYLVNYDMSGRHFGYNFDGEGQTRDYRADVGFNRRTNTNRDSLFVRYESEPKPKANLISWRLINVTGVRYDWQARIQGWDEMARLGLTLKRQTFVAVGYVGEYERVFEEEFGPKRTLTRSGAFAGSDPERSAYRKAIFTVVESNPTKKYSGFFFLATTGACSTSTLAQDHVFPASARLP